MRCHADYCLSNAVILKTRPNEPLRLVRLTICTRSNLVCGGGGGGGREMEDDKTGGASPTALNVHNLRVVDSQRTALSIHLLGLPRGCGEGRGGG